MEERVAVVRGKRIEEMAGSAVRARAAGYTDVIVDLGAGDGRWAYKFARRHPELLCVGIDANPDLVDHISRRALRSPKRGGAPNLMFLRAPVAALPGPLVGIANLVQVQFPWGSLLRAVVRPEVETMTRITGLMKPRGVLEVLVNVSALTRTDELARMDIPSRTLQAIQEDMVSSYPAAGLVIRRWEIVTLHPESTWAGRLGRGLPLSTLRVEAQTS